MKLLIVDDDIKFRDQLVSLCEFEHIDTQVADNGLSAQRYLEQETFEAVVMDLNMPGMNGLELLRWIQEDGPALPVLMMSGYGEINDAVDAMKLGAQDYIVKPFEPEVLFARLRRIIDNQRLSRIVERGRSLQYGWEGWIGNSPQMMAIKALIEKIAPTPSTVLLTGKSGTGKEVIARAIHQHSPRADKPFLAINIGGVPENLLESELFGYEKGAFTGAAGRKIGLFEIASSGTLLLDEIGDMPLHLQGKLLRVLQERKIQRLGGTRDLPIDVRIIAATNKNLEELVRQERFREDMFYRLNVIRIAVPTLNERQEDIPLLVGHFIQCFNALIGKNVRGIAPDALRALEAYDFPGNVRELENLIERAVILADTETITLKNLGLTPPIARNILYHGTLQEIERQAIAEALLRWEGNRTHAANELGITRKTLISKIKLYRLE
ncbi:response regulator containing CheY-like receiver, AAA-type ATPase, and DNA-binding domains [Candidatus Moduliflexus flocculans]|uniref:Response regulator containing CheY-like receiver, AAA-type ATPase, and DNA-binding domains n=1 Tax=Candidatus Moduliflexus flocculans TaxID=1499966 RepID=A0A0S6W502_9BACT|nr:response regulator containing CheY-like receiver, AAA-type ATPase, and DNA-binding domains [Candidatus Moduliflexus flocculans]